MITLTFISNTLGLSLSILGAMFGVIGFFGEKNEDLYSRTKLYFFNEKHFEALIKQKYKTIVGFLLITTGLALQFFPYVFAIKQELSIEKHMYLIYLFVFISICWLLVDKAINFLAHNIIRDNRLPEELGDYYSYKQKIDEGNEKFAEPLNKLLITMSKRLRIKRDNMDQEDFENYIIKKVKSKTEKTK